MLPIPTPAPDDPAASAAHRPRRAGWAVALRWLALAMLALVIAAWLALQWAILPRLEHWRGDLEKQASRALGRSVRIGTVATLQGSGLFADGIEFGDVRLSRPGAAAGEAAALRLPRVRAVLSPRSLLPGADGRWRWRFAELSVEAAEIEARRDAEGRIWIAGIELGAGGPGTSDGEAADWFFSQPEFALRGATLRWQDALRGGEPLAFTDVDLIVRNGGRSHALRLDATPPAAWGQRLSLRGQFGVPLLGGQVLPKPGDWRHWRGELYAELPALELAALRGAVDLPFGLQQGNGALRAWVEVDAGKPVGATADLALRDLALQPDADAAPLAFARIDGRIGLRDGWRANVPPGVAAFGGRAPQPGGELRLERLSFDTADGLAWPAASAQARWRLDAEGALAGGELRAERIDLALLAQTAARLPARWLAEGPRTAIASLAPEGVASKVELSWDGALPVPARYRAQATVQGLALASLAEPVAPEAPASAPPRPGRPGLRNADVELSATEAGGRMRISVRDGALDVPGVFELPRVALDRLDANVAWTVTPARREQPLRLEVRSRDLRFANADAAGEFDLGWALGAPDAAGHRGPGVIALSGQLRNADAARVARYLPLGISAGVRGYVERAVQSGRAELVEAKVRGDLRRFPFATPAPDSDFHIAAKLAGVRFTHSSGDAAAGTQQLWPPFDDVRGELVFERATMELRNLQARVGGGENGTGAFQLQKVNGAIKDLQHATLTIDGNGRGPLQEALAYVHATPIGGWTGGALAEASASGGTQLPAELTLALTLPLGESAATPKQSVKGRVVLAGNDLKLRPDIPLLANAKARIAFSDTGFDITNGSARALGGDLTLDGGRQADGSLRFTIAGTASAEGLRRQAEGGPYARLAARLRGQGSYRLALGIVEGQPEWLLTSNLAGLAAELPAPLAKPAADAWPLRVQSLLVPESLQAHRARGAPLRELLRVDLGPENARLLQAQWLRELSENGPRVLRGGIGVGESAPQPAEGVIAAVSLPRLDLDAWQKLAAEAGGSADGNAAAASADAGVLPTTIALRARELVVEGRALHEVVAGISRGTGADIGVWRANLDAVELGGYAEYRAPGARGSGDAGGRVFARLARLSLPKGEDEAVSSLLEQAAPSTVPALDIVVEDFELRGKKLGRLEIEALNRGEAGAREWRLAKLRLATPEAQLNATGQWGAGESRRRAQLDFKLDVTDGGALLARLGQGEVLRGAKGKLAGQLSWMGSPLAIDYPSLGGQINVALDRGQFLKADPGIAKLLGVLSLQALPRRLLLDFRDVFQEGFAFDTVTGDVSIASGVATTRNLRMRGVQAVVLMEGSADVARETQDLRVWVVPEINAGTAALAFAAINPAIGIGSFVAQWLLKKPIGDAGTREFRVTGPWADPKVDRIERKLRDPVPSMDDPASAPAAAPDLTSKD